MGIYRRMVAGLMVAGLMVGTALIWVFTGSGARAWPAGRPLDLPWWVPVQVTAPDDEPSTAARLRAVVEGIKRRLAESEGASDNEGAVAAPEEAPTPAAEAAGPASALPDVEVRIRALRERMLGLARALTEARNERERLLQQLSSKDEEIARLKAEVKTARERAASAAAERLEAFERRLEAAETARAELARELERTQGELTRSAEALQELRKEKSRLEAKLADAERQVKDLTATLDQAWKERNDLEQQLAAMRQVLEEQQQEFDRQLAAAQQRIQEAEAEAERLRQAGMAQSREIGELEQQIAQLQQRVQQLSRENRDLQAVAVESVNQLKEVSDRLFQALEEKERLTRALAALRETERLLQQLGETAEAIEPAAGAAPPGNRAVRRRFEPAAGSPEAPAGESPTDAGTERGQAPGDDEARATPSSPGTEIRVAAATPTPEAERAPEVDGGLEVFMTEDGWLRTILEGLAFEPGSAEPRAGYERVLERAAALIRLYPEAPVRIEGHTDSVGPAERNRLLSLQRARRVRQLLAEHYGIDSRRIEVLGVGEARPIASNDTPEGRARNRRIELWLHPGGVSQTVGNTPVN